MKRLLNAIKIEIIVTAIIVTALVLGSMLVFLGFLLLKEFGFNYDAAFFTAWGFLLFTILVLAAYFSDESSEAV
jgi:hypothetical protein